MHVSGRLDEDSPDPVFEVIEKARRMPVPVYGLTPQRHVEDWDAFGVQTGVHNGEFDACTVSIGYTLWRNPDNIHDPANLAELDEETLRGLEREPPWPRPHWLIERTRRMRLPMLWECVRTSWRRTPRPYDSVEAQLAAHVNHVLENRFHSTRARGPFPHELDSPVDERHVERDVPLRVDGYERRGIRIDTDPDVYGVGIALRDDTVLTAVVPRDELRFIELAFATRVL